MKRLKPYWQALNDIFQYQVVSKLCIGACIGLLGGVFTLLLKSTGRVALTSGDFMFVFTSWQGWLILLLGLVVLFVYVALDLNVKIILSRHLLQDETVSVSASVKEGFLSIPKFFDRHGIGVVLYIALIAPLLGFGMSISLTEGLCIPTFVSSVIKTTPLYLTGVSALLFLFIIVGLRNMFILHGVVLDGLDVKAAGTQSKRLIRKNWKDYLLQNVKYAAVSAAVVAAVVLLFLVLPLMITAVFSVTAGVKRGLTIFIVLIGSVLTAITGLFVTPLYVMKLTQLFYTYKEEEKRFYPVRPKKKHPLVVSGTAVLCIGIIAAAVFMNYHFEELFPAETTAGIIAHRAGGNEGPENTVAGLIAASDLGAYGSEIDIQRTADGAYVVNHDGTFKRTAGDGRTPEEMTLQEVRELSVGGEPVATFEEMLEASRGTLLLFTELKGSTADKKMADDAVRIIREYGMEEECVLISLKYDLIDYIETAYPDILTGYLTWASFGNTAALHCDFIGLEEESATGTAIRAIHEQGKKALVWTANDRESQKHFLCSDVDGIITDNVKQAKEVIEELKGRTDFERIADALLGM